ncbi:argininosuccinate synthase [Desulforhopalus vacuolatus]|uniref:argininosuccinate synthase n=1 Tax=Desulforhopalus vacuolatus TaxID=40414 RepID=UPI001962D481|nr:argininosuccinate synthase [Desulforhopalus vacuolatus]MBM9520211.1 argininosuccinate synthase [Desulforhopalus vacuolatus]
MSVEKIVLAYSGGLDTSVILKWLAEEYKCPVVAYAANIGQKEDWAAIEKKGLATGAEKVIISDLRKEFVEDYIFPAYRANGIYEGSYLLGTSLARPLIAREQVRIAQQEGANAVSHGATGKGNDQVRFELGYISLDPNLQIIAPWRIWDLTSRAKLVQFAEEHHIPVPVTKKNPYSCDENLLHISYEGGLLEDPWNEPDEDMFKWTVSPEKAPDKATYLEVEFKNGDPVALDGNKMEPLALFTRLNDLAAANGIGRLDLVEDRFVGMKSHGVYETPGGTLLRECHRTLETICLDREVMKIRDSLISHYSELVYNGFWFSPERELLQKTMDETQKVVNGVVRMKLYKGNCTPVGRKSAESLYREDVATFEEDSVYDQGDATGFIRLNGLRLKINAKLNRYKR